MQLLNRAPPLFYIDIRMRLRVSPVLLATPLVSPLTPTLRARHNIHDQMEQGPTEPHAGHSTFLLSSGGAGDY